MFDVPVVLFTNKYTARVEQCRPFIKYFFIVISHLTLVHDCARVECDQLALLDVLYGKNAVAGT